MANSEASADWKEEEAVSIKEWESMREEGFPFYR